MSGEWIKMRVDLRFDPAVLRLAKLTKMDKLSVVGRLYAFWCWTDGQAMDGAVPGVDASDIDDICEKKGFADAMVEVGWLEFVDGGIRIPKHERHNGESAKERSMKNARQAKWRRNRDADVDAAPSTPPSTGSSTPPSTREEKRREEEIQAPPASRVPPTASPRATKKCPPGFAVTEDLRRWAAEKAPGVNVDAETEAMRDHTFGTARSDWDGTWRNWIRKAAAGPPKRNGHGATAAELRMASAVSPSLLAPHLRPTQPPQPTAEVIDVTARRLG